MAGYEITDARVGKIDLDAYLRQKNPDVVINAIGRTGEYNIDWCESNVSAVVEANVSIPLELALACKKRGIRFVHLGSGCMFNGDNDGQGFTDYSVPSFPGKQIYNTTKIIIERWLLDRVPDCLQVRIRMPVDSRSHPKNLIDKLIRYADVVDAENSMTVLPDCIPVLIRLIDLNQKGVFNLVNRGSISPATIMKEYRERVNPRHVFHPCTIGWLNSITTAERTNCILKTERLDELGIQLPPIIESVRKCLDAWKSSK